MDVFKNEVTWEDLGDWVSADDLHGITVSVSIQQLRERMERVFGWSQNAEILMRIPHALLSGETPWDVLYHTPCGPRRIENILDLMEQGRLLDLAKPQNPATARRRTN